MVQLTVTDDDSVGSGTKLSVENSFKIIIRKSVSNYDCSEAIGKEAVVNIGEVFSLGLEKLPSECIIENIEFRTKSTSTPDFFK